MIRQSCQNHISIFKCNGVSLRANDNIYDHGLGQEMLVKEIVIQNVADACSYLLEALLIDTEDDHNTKDTARRMALMFVNEVCSGRYEPMPEIKEFPNVRNIDQIYTVGPCTIRSLCSHHFVPICGQCWMGILPDPEGKVLGISKFTRLANWIFRRPQIQEEATHQLAEVIEGAISPRGLAVVVRAEHLCMTWRGVKDCGTTMVTSDMRGVFKDDGNARSEFFNLIKGQGY